MEEDKEEALHYYRRARAQGHAATVVAVAEGHVAGLVKFAQILEAGFTDWPADPEAAAEFYHRAGVQGHSEAAERALELTAQLRSSLTMG